METPRQADAKMENTGVGRIDASAYVARFDQMPSWESRLGLGSWRWWSWNVLDSRVDVIPVFLKHSVIVGYSI